MELTGTELIFGALGVVGVISILRGIIWFFKREKNFVDGIFSGIGGFIAIGCGLVDLLFATLYWTPQSTHLFVVGCVVLFVACARSLFGTVALLE